MFILHGICFEYRYIMKTERERGIKDTEVVIYCITHDNKNKHPNLPVPPIRDNFPFPFPGTGRLSSVEHLSNIVAFLNEPVTALYEYIGT